MLSFILGNNANIRNLEGNGNLQKSLLETNLNRKMETVKHYPISELWKFGISGDLPIIFVTIKNINDIDVISELVKAYEYFRMKNLEIDLVILNEEKENYDSYVKDAIHDAILNRNIAYMLNIRGGIYVLNNIKKEDKNLIIMHSKMVIDAADGNLNLQLNDLEDEIPKINVSNNTERAEIVELIEELKQENQLLNNNLQYYNEYGGFSPDGKEYLIRVNKDKNCPMPWSHIMANNSFGTLVTESMGGYSWYNNSRLNRISAWSNNPIIDIPSEAIYLKDEETKKAWSLGLNPMSDNNDYYVCYGFGYAKYNHTSMRN